MNEQKTATCTVTTWDPPHQLRLTWHPPGEVASEVGFRLAGHGEQTQVVVEHTRICVDAVRYGAGWHVHLDSLVAHLASAANKAEGCDGEDFQAAYRVFEQRYAAAATADDGANARGGLS